ncbi:hypothetical protein H2200_009442 [Cladophialophora chaetospira]|uniref:Cytochrome b561 domain-containing protein n=1 Tax=Cladophialophora chaetospira TaxID=386627 RepID=A0AA38X4A9_9EURO|nr:hypothetical protein H2200_009442 [Cladophialophora chaetospira]
MGFPLPHGFFAFFAFLLLATSTLGNQIQFYQKSEHFGVAITSTEDAGNADFLVQLSAPISYGWAALGTGDKMDKSLMFILYPSRHEDDVVLSVRSTGGHDTPDPVSGINATLLSSTVEAGIMTATIQWHQSTGHKYHTIDVARSKQAWIWAVGPQNEAVEDAGSVDAGIEQHSHYGVFFADMPAAQNDEPTLPKIAGTSSLHAKGQPEYYHGLVYAHATLLGAAFVLVFPLGVIALRWNWPFAFKGHWILQAVASVAAYLGAILAIVLSVVGIEYSDFTEGHQILGLIVVGLVSLQLLLGYLHHQQYKKQGRRSVSSYFHIGLGRVLIYAGMVNAVLGALLSDETGAAAAVGAVAAVLAAAMEFMAFRHRRRIRGLDVVASKSSSDIALNSRS